MKNRESGVIDVYVTNIAGLLPDDYETLYRKVSPERRKRADGFREREDAVRCVTAEALLRHVLGWEQYAVVAAPGGKPYIPECPDFHFSLSHSGNWVVLACGSTEVGVDVERVRENTDVDRIAGRFFAPEERDYLRRDPARMRERFFEVWTKKESYGKFLGTGLRNPARLNVFAPPPGVLFFHRALDDCYRMTLCTTGKMWQLRQIDVRDLLR